MPTPILMPALSPTMEEGTLAKWNVKEGDIVSSGDVIAEIETDKATMEVEAVDEGTVGKIIVPAGAENVKVNAPIAILLGDGESAADLDKVDAPDANGPSFETPKAAPSAPHDERMKRPHPEEDAKAPVSKGAVSNGRVHASPLAKRMAKNAGIDLAALTGTGPHGRIVKRDVEAAENSAGSKPAPAQAFTPSPASVDPRLYPADSYTAVKLDGMRKVIARRLTQSFNNEVPHFPLNVDIELTKLMATHTNLNTHSP